MILQSYALFFVSPTFFHIFLISDNIFLLLRYIACYCGIFIKGLKNQISYFIGLP